MFLPNINTKKLFKLSRPTNTIVEFVTDKQAYSNDKFIVIKLKDLSKLFSYDPDKNKKAWHIDKLQVRFSPNTDKPIYLVNHFNRSDFDSNGNSIQSYTLSHEITDRESYKEKNTKVYIKIEEEDFNKLEEIGAEKVKTYLKEEEDKKNKKKINLENRIIHIVTFKYLDSENNKCKSAVFESYDYYECLNYINFSADPIESNDYKIISCKNKDYIKTITENNLEEIDYSY